MAFQEIFYDALAALLEKNGIANATVVNFDEVTEYGGYCETCAYEYTEVNIAYEVDGVYGVYRYSGSFGELIRSLSES